MTESQDIIKEKKVPNQGKTLRMLRNVSGKTQLQVAKDNDMSQSKIFELEMREQLSDKELEIFAQYYGVSVEFLKTFDVDALSQGNVTTNYNTLHDHSSLNNYHPLDKVCELYREIVDLTKENTTLKYELELLKKNQK